MKKRYLVLMVGMALLAGVGSSYAQQLPGLGCLNAPCVNDPCAIYPHKSAVIPTAGASPSTTLISGAANQRTYICGYEFTLSGSSPDVMLGIGQSGNSSGGTATPCGTGTASIKAIAMEVGGPGSGSLAGAGDSWVQSPGTAQSTLVGPFPAVATATAQTWDLCVTSCPAGQACTGNVKGHVIYVQGP